MCPFWVDWRAATQSGAVLSAQGRVVVLRNWDQSAWPQRAPLLVAQPRAPHRLHGESVQGARLSET